MKSVFDEPLLDAVVGDGRDAARVGRIGGHGVC
jgi:hypothetical protein